MQAINYSSRRNRGSYHCQQRVMDMYSMVMHYYLLHAPLSDGHCAAGVGTTPDSLASIKLQIKLNYFHRLSEKRHKSRRKLMCNDKR